MSRPYTQDRFALNNSDSDFIPVNPVIGVTRDPNARDPQALIPESRDRSIVAKFDPETSTLTIGAHFIEKDGLNAQFKLARERGQRVKRIILYVSQDCWADDMHFFLRNGFDRRESLENGTARIALVKDLTAPKAEVNPPERPGPALEPAPLTPEQIARETRELEVKIAALKTPRSVDSIYRREFEPRK